MSVSDAQADMLVQYFRKCVISSAGGKTLPEDKMKAANGKAIMKMIEPLMGKADAQFCEGGVVTKLSDKKTRTMHVDTFKGEFFPELAEYAVKNIEKLKKKGTSKEEFLQKLLTGAEAELAKESKTVKTTDCVDRLTDTSKYTGSHKGRFDDSGKGKGIDGRVDKVENSGYVGNYKGAGTFDGKK